MKRLCDVIASLLLLIILSPLLLIIALLVKRDIQTGVIFAHRRIGRYGRQFRCYKFRTMRNGDLTDYEKRMYFENFKLKNDPRVTRLGRFLRATSLDELPQLFNVLRGDMSLVGPRPIVYAEAYKYGDKLHDVLRSRPGITGLWQVCGRHKLTYDERVTLDYIYAKHGGILLDIGILLQTIRILLQPTNY